MKMIVILLSFLSFSAFAQNVDLKGVNAGDDTTIQIKKGNGGLANPVKYEIISGDDDITGDAAPLLKDARENWKTACNDWKKETKETNKDNKIISINCGTMSCSSAEMESTCTSKAKTKIRVKIEE